MARGAPRALVLTGNGTNCEREMAEACRLGGFAPVIAHLADLLDGTVRLDEFHLLNLPGGFLDGDDLGSARAQSIRLRHAAVAGGNGRLADQFARFVERGRLVLGVCNGFQLMVKMGLLPGLDRREGQTATLTHNDSGRFEDRWVRVAADPGSPCIFTRGMDMIELPVRHGEGKFVVDSEVHLVEMDHRRLIALRYCDERGRPTESYPANPNGSRGAVAGVCSPSGLLFGLMPHPEAFLNRVNHPRWTREDLPDEGAGVLFFRNAAVYAVQAFGGSRT
jgi:phosphoribosylformylglycinamidine (FGAM) synthase-like amidotransferase family enzyme